MSIKINTVLLIDDDLTINYYHNRLLQKIDISKSILISKNGKEGLASLIEINNNVNGEEIVIIFLDLNMPIMNGWEFLENLSKVKNNINLNFNIYILSSSINPEDEERAKKNELVTGFLSKPLGKENIEQIKLKYLQ
ncbi:response regulator [Flavobacterium sp. N1994]|uniref:response regulator n=1 Tax=Flavobacterium sp. N1994 TaxID=2986827 RepID=UPI002223AF96|nr:response regulator [Flavobacterium sp. N1994]